MESTQPVMCSTEFANFILYRDDTNTVKNTNPLSNVKVQLMGNSIKTKELQTSLHATPGETVL